MKKKTAFLRSMTATDQITTVNIRTNESEISSNECDCRALYYFKVLLKV